MTPIRTCIGCGARAPRGELRRLAEVRGDLVFDRHGRLRGRGAYLHPRQVCADGLTRSRGRIRSLRWSPLPAARARVATEVLAATGAAR